MNIFRLAVELFVIYLLYKLVFEFIIPVYRSTRHIKQKMTEMHQKMQDQEESYERDGQTGTHKQPTNSKKSYSDDYIEYEEIK